MYKNILHATDLSDQHFEICKKAMTIARHFHAKLHLLHVIEAPLSLQVAQGLGFAEISPPLIDDAITVIRALGEALHIPVKQQWVEIGTLKILLSEKARELDCSLIILGKTTHHFIEDTPCDVLLLN